MNVLGQKGLPESGQMYNNVRRIEDIGVPGAKKWEKSLDKVCPGVRNPGLALGALSPLLKGVYVPSMIMCDSVHWKKKTPSRKKNTKTLDTMAASSYNRSRVG
jgi:hypothetical protein